MTYMKQQQQQQQQQHGGPGGGCVALCADFDPAEAINLLRMDGMGEEADLLASGKPGADARVSAWEARAR
jgi:hypothetical protein